MSNNRGIRHSDLKIKCSEFQKTLLRHRKYDGIYLFETSTVKGLEWCDGRVV